jgi:hypothetical protein
MELAQASQKTGPEDDEGASSGDSRRTCKNRGRNGEVDKLKMWERGLSATREDGTGTVAVGRRLLGDSCLIFWFGGGRGGGRERDSASTYAKAQNGNVSKEKCLVSHILETDHIYANFGSLAPATI